MGHAHREISCEAVRVRVLPCRRAAGCEGEDDLVIDRWGRRRRRRVPAIWWGSMIAEGQVFQWL